jgi:serine O-acetyltransferase
VLLSRRDGDHSPPPCAPPLLSGCADAGEDGFRGFHSATGVDIHPGAEIGESFFIDHGAGVVIGETAVIGARVRLYQGVTLGTWRFEVDDNGGLLKSYPRHPIIEDDVVIYAGASILGRITVGRGSTIAGSVWLTNSVPPDSTITQARVRSEAFDAGGGI